MSETTEAPATEARSLAADLRTFVQFMAQFETRSETAPRSPMALLLAHGRTWPGQPLPSGIRLGKAKACFQNAHELCMTRDLVYCEGFAASGLGIPIHHAWAVDPATGGVIDPTWRWQRRQRWVDHPSTWVYLGLPFQRTYAMQHIMRNRHYGILYSRCWPGYLTEAIETVLESMPPTS
jgi:hypothetical protein